MPDKVTPYPKEILPSGFSYPKNYLRFAEEVEVPDELIWWFPGEEFDHAAAEWEFRLVWKSKGWLYLDDIDPIPFARNGDWAAFFDGNDLSGDPKVVVVDLGNKENSYRLPNFDAWFDRALWDSGLK
ncbi:hypothetical protein [Granulibacter bethesdensis]|uniref:hypothetical protein n=1 Tax=Granulibacter bethesdensis TaxID=364410 RepID=UPI000930DE10|nr:hypothetical protein [Granulibacter bethesdensis]